MGVDSVEGFLRICHKTKQKIQFRKSAKQVSQSRAVKFESVLNHKGIYEDCYDVTGWTPKQDLF